MTASVIKVNLSYPAALEAFGRLAAGLRRWRDRNAALRAFERLDDRDLRDIGVDTSQTISTVERPTAEYAAILDARGSLAIGIADMDIFDLFTAAHIERIWPHLAAASWVFGWLTALVVVRVRHLSLIMVTLGIGLLLYEVANRESWLTG